MPRFATLKTTNSPAGNTRAPGSLKADVKGNLILDFTGGVHPEPKVFDYWPTRVPSVQVRPFADVDFETFYTDKYSIRLMSGWEYVNHVAFDAHTVAIATVREPNNPKVPWKIWVGHPQDFEWSSIANLEWISHNAGFDELVYRRLQHLKICPSSINPLLWSCSADMTAYLQEGRDLESAAKNLLGMIINKDVRAKMKGGGATTQEILDYAGGDVIGSGMLWLNFSQWWPEWEQLLSRMTRYSGWRGVPVDVEGCKRDIAFLEARQIELIKTLPWGGKRKNSIQTVRAQCAKEGILPPPNLSLDDEATEAWHNKYKENFPWVATIRLITKCRQTADFCRLLLARTRSNRTAPFGLRYALAPHTLRWGNEKKLRMHNLDKEPVEGVHVRHKLSAGPGYKFIIADLAQIEPRSLNWRVGNTAFLEACHKGQSPYEAHARASMGYNLEMALKKADPVIYALAKARVLALGYQAGPERFIEMARIYAGLILELDECIYLSGEDRITEKEWSTLAFNHKLNTLLHPVDSYKMIPSSRDSVADFRKSNPLIVKFWYECQNDFYKSIGGNHFVAMPSGGFIRYFDVREVGEEVWADVIHNTTIPKHSGDFYGGKLCENWCQRFGRDVLGWDLVTVEKELNIPAAPVPNVWSVHDEGIWRVREDHAERALKDVLQVMHTAPPWAPGLPVAAEGGIFDHYCK